MTDHPARDAEKVTLEALGQHLGWGTRTASEVFNFACERERLLRIAQAELDTHKSDAATAELALRDRLAYFKDLEADVSRLRGEVDANIAIRADLEKMLEAAEARVRDLEWEVAQYDRMRQGYMDHANARVAAADAEISRLRGELEKATDEASVLQDQIDNHYIPRVVEAESRYDSETGKLGQRIGAERKRAEAAEALVARMDTERKALEQRLDDEQDAREAAEARLSALQEFARLVLDGYRTGVVGDIDGGWLQDTAASLGLLVEGTADGDPNLYMADWLSASLDHLKAQQEDQG